MNVSRVCNRLMSSAQPLRSPSIKFRYGTKRPQHTIESSTSAISTRQSSVTVSGEAIPDYQLPLKYRRKLIDEDEIAYINRGGPEL